MAKVGIVTKKRSLAWDHFYEEGDSTICDICKEEVKTSGNTSNLFKVDLYVNNNNNHSVYLF